MKMGRIPVVAPPWEDLPWAVAFTTLAYRDGENQSCAREGCETMRAEVAAATGCARMQWLGILHGADVIETPTVGGEGAGCAGTGRDAPIEQESINIEASRASTGGDAAPGSNTLDADRADAAVVRTPNCAAGITTADCLPVIIADPICREVAVAHAGWRGLAAGILENTLRILASGKSEEMIRAFRVWIGPSIGADYEIGAEVRDALMESSHVTSASFLPRPGGSFLADLPDMARSKLLAGGIHARHIIIYPGSVKNNRDFFSVRRDGQRTGRMATVAGILPNYGDDGGEGSSISAKISRI